MAVAEGQPSRQNPAYRPAGIFYVETDSRFTWTRLAFSSETIRLLRMRFLPRGAWRPRGERRGAGRVGPFSLVYMDAAFAAPRKRKGLPAAIPQIASDARGVTNIFAS